MIAQLCNIAAKQYAQELTKLVADISEIPIEPEDVTEDEPDKEVEE